MAFLIKSFLNPSLSQLFLLLLLFQYLGCFSLPHQQRRRRKPDPSKPIRRKISPLIISIPPCTSTPNPHRTTSLSPIVYLNRLLRSFRRHHEPPPPPPPPPSYNLNSLSLSPEYLTIISNNNKSPPPPTSSTKSLHDIFPCSTCGEVLPNPHLLALHQATKHSLSELRNGDSGNSIVQIIFQSGWKGKSSPLIHRILKIHNTPKTLARFEDYRDIVRSRAARDRRSIDGRCLADGNERLRFYCSTILCAEMPAMAGVCGSPYCSTCGILRHGFVGKQVDLDGLATHATGWGAHVSLPEELEREFAFLHVRRAVLVCRVVAGRVARGGEMEDEEGRKVFDSVVPVRTAEEQEEELLVFNPRAVLPCFVIIYSMM